MTLTGLLPVLSEDPAVSTLVDLADPSAADTGAVDVVCSEGLRPPLLAALAGRRPLLVVTATAREADDTVAGLRSFLPEGAVAGFPAWETLPHERLSPRSDTVAERLQVLRRLAHPDDRPGEAPLRVVVAPVRSVMQPFAVGLGDLAETHLRAGDRVDLADVVRGLADAAYHRVDMVERRGEFAVRGGIVDVFPPTAAHPVRVEFFGDEVDELREFAVADQRSLGTVEELLAPPCRELLLTDAVRERAAGLLDAYPGAAELLTKVAEGSAVEGMEAFIPVLVDRMTTLLHELPEGALVVTVEPARVDSRAQDLLDTGKEFLEAAWSNAAAGNVTPVDIEADGLQGGMFRTLPDLHELAEDLGLDWWTAGTLTADAELRDARSARLVTVDARPVNGYRGDLAEASRDLAAHVADGWRLVVVTEGHGPAQHLVQVLAKADVPARLVDSLDAAPEPGVVHVTCGGVLHGFVHEDLRAALLTEADLAGQRTSTKDMRKMPSKRRQVVDPLTLKPGDHVVHETHGIGRFVEMTQRVVQGATREYLVLEYAPSKRNQPGDRVYVPTDALDLVSRYVGGEGPALSKMGGSDWAKAKGRARKAVKQIAGELIQLYSARMASVGHAFAPDTVWQRELEDAFPYAETPDQLASIDEVKADMEKPVPMDRLICGDVGYGKTEIALRAAFKAVMDGKQVAVLVPTTLLVQQHLSTFSERFAGYPVVVRALSRFSSEAEARSAREGVADGSVDVVIGTHRLLGKDMRFSDLGLVVIDEEQRFGVEHKEQLKKLRTNVDVLAMSATPIPRTLEMAVTGIREMSTLATPPEERHPILTYVGPYDERQVGAAIRRELLREGQVFFVHNRVSDIERTAAHLQSLVPEARIRIAHGQMHETELEQTVVDFWERRFDVLVCTTIVETGLDIANANTLILDRADTFGLSQLHQLRGRVGRGRERAYAYFMWSPGATLTDTAHDRLSTIAANTELGAGMQVAMKDLEIRGAGNLLGGEQSGHIEGVGFDLYLRMVAEAVTDYRRGIDGDGEPDPVDTTLDLPVDAYLPHDYVPAERLRLEAYRRLAAATDDAAVDAVAEDLRDRFGAAPDGQLPSQVRSLLGIARLRVFLRGYGLKDVSVQGKFLRLAPVDLAESARLRLERLYPKTVVKPSLGTVLVPLPTAPMAGRPIGGPVGDAELVDWVRSLVSTVLPAPEKPVVVAATDPAAPAPEPGSTAAAAAALADGPRGRVGAVPFRTEHEPATKGPGRR
ncbi:transcription-repair coupling factor [Aquipuribacter hungaricus]|uniref:Transcription-repair-coupling factor n=1 Tax=Aquipuribacter hungaricus TaxID=545624 RepID=A0ABV7WCU1_9MICO